MGQDLSVEGGGAPGAAGAAGAGQPAPPGQGAAAGMKGTGAYLGSWFGGGAASNPNAQPPDAGAGKAKPPRGSIYVQVGRLPSFLSVC